MAHAHVQVRFQRTSLLPEDICVNTFDFFVSGPTVGAADAATIAQKVRDFYLVPATGFIKVSDLLSPVLTRGTPVHEVRVYDMGLPMPRQPVFTLLFAMTATTNAVPIPSEVALVLSLRAPIPSGGVAGRYRGRIYLGPLNGNVTSTGTVVAGDIRPSLGSREGLLEAGRMMLAGAAETIAWSVFSGMDNATRRITRLVVDDAFDTQRRRGAKPTTRLEATKSQV